MFTIDTPSKFLEKCRADNAAFQNDIADPRLAMTAFLSVYHLHEWVWARWLKRNSSVRKALGFSKQRDFVSWLDQTSPHFRLIQELANGVKHCAPVSSTGQVAGHGTGPFGVGPFGAAYLLIDRGSQFKTDERYLVASEVIVAAMDFWEVFFAKHSIP